jgi:hypothetical protein
LDQRTKEFAARLVGFNAIQHAAIDERSKRSKGERLVRAKRVDIYEEGLRQLDRHKRAIALVGDAPPIKFFAPPFVQACPEELARAANKGTPYVIDFQTAEAHYKSIGAEKAADSRSNLGRHSELFQPQTSADEIEEERTRRRPRLPTADGDSLEI